MLKNKAVSLICSGEIPDLKILHSGWLRPFLPILGLVQQIIKILNSKSSILVHFCNFWVKKSFPKKLDCHTQFYKGFQHHAKIQTNLTIQFQENTQTDCRKKRGKDPFSSDLSGYCQRSNKYHCSRLAFKSQTYRV